MAVPTRRLPPLNTCNDRTVWICSSGASFGPPCLVGRGALQEARSLVRRLSFAVHARLIESNGRNVQGFSLLA